MSDYQIAISGMGRLLEDHGALIERFSRRSYSESFMNYYRSAVPVFDAVENLYTAVVDKDAMLSNMAQALCENAEQIYASAPKRQRETLKVNLSLTMASYVYPSIYQYRGTSSKALADHCQKAWKEHFPKSNITPAPFEDIEQGFHKKFCFITTAACEMKGMEDDCYELNLLRNYRDTYMASLGNGDELIRSYYDVAPSIVKHINERGDRTLIYEGIWDAYIDPCIHMIEEGKMEECLATYTAMVGDLKEQYFHLYPNVKHQQ